MISKFTFFIIILITCLKFVQSNFYLRSGENFDEINDYSKRINVKLDVIDKNSLFASDIFTKIINSAVACSENELKNLATNCRLEREIVKNASQASKKWALESMLILL